MVSLYTRKADGAITLSNATLMSVDRPCGSAYDFLMWKRTFTRRGALIAAAAAGVTALSCLARTRSTVLGYPFSGPAADRSLGLAAPLACTRAIPASTEGPFYTSGTPLRTNLREPDTSGQPLVVHGLVLSPDCRPISGAVVDIWHTDEQGDYDNSGFRYRGHQYTDAAGAFRFETIRPVRYTGRTPHIHVKVQGPSTRLLTTQIYFPDLPDENARDGIYHDDLLLDLKHTTQGWLGRFDFVLATA